MIRYNVVCVGCGGTGSFFIKEFARFMAAFQKQGVSVALSIMDGDRIEEKNLERQCFMDEDINNFKALTMAEAVKEGFLLDEVYAFPLYLDEKNQLSTIFDDMKKDAEEKFRRSVNTINILIGCVDNHRARQVMEAYFKESRVIFYFDSANEYSTGEVVFGGKHNGAIIGQSRAFYFPNIMKDRSKRASELGCGAINKTSPQHMVTNMMAANLLLGKLIRLIADGKISLGISYFNAFEPFINFHPYKMKGGESSEAEAKGEKPLRKGKRSN